jgi:hypothetical protein
VIGADRSAARGQLLASSRDSRLRLFPPAAITLQDPRIALPVRVNWGGAPRQPRVQKMRRCIHYIDISEQTGSVHYIEGLTIYSTFARRSYGAWRL